MAKPLKVDEVWLDRIAGQLNDMEFGSLHIVVHEGQIVQMERTERKRFENTPSGSASKIRKHGTKQFSPFTTRIQCECEGIASDMASGIEDGCIGTQRYTFQKLMGNACSKSSYLLCATCLHMLLIPMIRFKQHLLPTCIHDFFHKGIEIPHRLIASDDGDVHSVSHANQFR